jgi:hypothetical protein
MSRTRTIAPGFTADASLTRSSEHYRASAVSYGGGTAGAVAPQIQAGGFGGVGGLGGIFSDLGCYLNYGFCLAGCAWGWLGDQKFGGRVANALGELCVAQCAVDLARCQAGMPPEPGIPLV